VVRLIPAIALVLVLVGAAGCGGDSAPGEDPGVFVTSVVRTLYRGQSGDAWELLHPEHRAAVSKERYVACERKAPLEGQVRRIEVVSVEDAPATVPGESEAVLSKAVTIRITLKLPGIPTAQPVTHTAHVFAVNGKWAWVIGPTDYATYLSGACPTGV
jgi:hypothetical protein